MEPNAATSEVTYHHEPSEGTGRIWKTFWLLSGITIVELALGFSMYFLHGSIPGWLILFLKGMIVILSLAKAFYIVSIFMHLGDEIKNMIMTIIVPLMLFVWFIGAFLWDGSAFLESRNRYNHYKESKTMQGPLEKKDTSVHPLH